ncbi:hypothetical protein BD410DRAFT_771528 [Rickenella mellea]|uniref:GYF domain-containing protein n=1 Tax=Rickenella mellea TaxID=50990 RepID=A0A4Y7Q2D3_9AGAM|nr:hypothetical protein BD410DRAFT_771528 [Rickenella mellea]
MAKTSSKRSAAAVSGATTSRSGAGGSSAKKTRFVSPSENPATFAEDVDEALETKSRKGRVRTEGYDSDSTDDGEGVVFSRKKGDGEDGEEDEDMFGAGSDDGKKKGRAGDDASMKKKKETKFLRLGDIEGQEFNDDGDGGSAHSYHSDDDDDLKSTTSGSESPLDEDDRVRRSKAGMGYTLSSFNMREEMEEGKFAADGTFVRTFDPHAMHDRWLDDVGGREIRRARRAKRRRERGERERRRRERDEEGGKEDMEKELVGILREGESVLEALARLGKEAAKVKKSVPKQRHKRPRKDDADSMVVDVSPPSTTTTPSTDPPTTTKTPAQTQIDRITTLASNLLAMGDTDIYSKTYRQLLVSLRSSGAVPESWTPHQNPKIYEYKWSVANAPPDTFGPFSKEEMLAWNKAQYFGESGEKVKVRLVPNGAGAGGWADWHDIFGAEGS